jgi:hypothetical protein
MKRSRGASIDATAVVTSYRLSRDTSEAFVLGVISPQLRQLVDLSNNAFAGLKENADTLGPRHAKYVFAWPVLFCPLCFFFHVVLLRCADSRQVFGHVHWNLPADYVRQHHFWGKGAVGTHARRCDMCGSVECVPSQRGCHGLRGECECRPDR